MGSGLARDLRYAARLWNQNPGFIAVALLSLALGIGANTTIFGVMNGVLLRSAPVKEPERLALLEEVNPQAGGRAPTFRTFEQWRKQSQAFEAMALCDEGPSGPATLTGAREAVRVRMGAADPNFFQVTGVTPLLGRTFLAEDAPAGPGRTMVLSYEFWQRWFGGDGNVLGRKVEADGMHMTIVGVMPPRFWLFPWAKDTDAWYVFNPASLPQSRWLLPVGRLRRGATVAQAQAEMDVLFRSTAQQQPAVYKNWSLRVQSLREWSTGGARETFYLLLGAVGFVLLIACANVANLLLARSEARRKEFAVRASLGAGRLRLFRQLLTESVALAVLGGALGLLVAILGTRVFVALAPRWFGAADIRLDVVVLAFALALSVATGFLFGLSPAVHASRADLNEALKETGGRSTGAGRSRGRNTLVVSEVALAMVLLTGAGLMINSFVRLGKVDLGFDPKNLLKAEVFLGGTRYWNNAGNDMKRVSPEGDAFFERLIERAEHLPGVASAAIGSMERSSPHQFEIVGRPPQDAAARPRLAFAEVSPGYFRTIGIGLVKGRLISDADRDGAPWVVVVSEAFVRRYFPKEEPLGQVLRLRIPSFGANLDIEEGRPREIVGVVKDVKYWGPRAQAPPVVYGSYRQHPSEYPGGSYSFHLWTKLLLRTSIPPSALTKGVEQLVKEQDKDQVAFDIMPLERRVADFVSPQRFWMQLFGIFGGLAVLLAVVGIYGVMSYSVSRRTQEIGVRMANGAQPRHILKLVLTQGLRLTSAGVAIGVLGSIGLTRLIEQYLFGVKATDPLTFIAVALLLTAAALAACYAPAYRASRCDPLAALRHE